VFERWFTIEWKREFDAFLNLVVPRGTRAAYLENEDTKALFEILMLFDRCASKKRCATKRRAIPHCAQNLSMIFPQKHDHRITRQISSAHDIAPFVAPERGVDPQDTEVYHRIDLPGLEDQAWTMDLRAGGFLSGNST